MAVLIMNKNDAVQKLQEFNKGAMELFQQMSFIRKPSSDFNVHRENVMGVTCDYWGPDEEQIKAVCCDVRKFIQKNDALKIEKLIPVYQSSIVPDEAKKIFNKAISELEKFKKQSSQHRIHGWNPTNNELLDVFLYGKVVHRSERPNHRSEKPKDVYDAWERSLSFPSLKSKFVEVLDGYLRAIHKICYANNIALEKLGLPKIMLRRAD